MEAVHGDAPLRQAYERWARVEADPRSPLYAEWARGAASDPLLMVRIGALPRTKQQPNLVFASARFVGIPLAPWADVRELFDREWPAIESCIRARATQTNEARRQAVLLPALASVVGPIALVEVGASAGLCLYPDRWRYRYGKGRTVGDASAPLLEADASPSTPIPRRVPDVRWRGGIDLNPLDPDDPDTRHWLETLIWPDARGIVDVARVDRLRTALAIARREHAHITRGDLVSDLGPVLAEAAKHAPTVVVWHSAVLAYLPTALQESVAAMLRRAPVLWIANEGSSLPIGPPLAGAAPGDFVLRREGEPLAVTDAHGASITWASDLQASVPADGR